MQQRSLTPYIALGFFMYVLYSTQFFPNFYASQQSIYHHYIGNQTQVNQLMDFALNHKFDTLETYTLQALTNGYLTETPDEETPILGTDPLIYLYATHNTETIGGTETAPMEAIPGDTTVLELAHFMGESFQEAGLPVFVEDRETQAVVEERGWHYARSYEVSREIMDSAIAAYPTLSYFFDIHRDATTGSEATVTVGGQEYALIQIVIGTDHENFQQNLAFANRVLQVMEERYPGLMLPSYIRLSGGAGNNGIYNQDLSPNALLFEIGGQDTSEVAAANAINALVDVLGSIIRE